MAKTAERCGGPTSPTATAVVEGVGGVRSPATSPFFKMRTMRATLTWNSAQRSRAQAIKAVGRRWSLVGTPDRPPRVEGRQVAPGDVGADQGLAQGAVAATPLPSRELPPPRGESDAAWPSVCAPWASARRSASPPWRRPSCCPSSSSGDRHQVALHRRPEIDEHDAGRRV